MSPLAPHNPTNVPDAQPPENRVYFPELDGLRFFAFFLIFLFHRGLSEPALSKLIGHDAAWALLQNGWVGVQLFFILSGYLITTLLLREEAALGTIDLRAFWVRRILRIWPLYYLIVVLVFLVLPGIHGSLGTADGRKQLTLHLPWFIGFLGNWSMILHEGGVDDTQSILWSVCVEEQFYVFVPLIVALVAPRWRVPFVVVGMAGAIGARAYVASTFTNPLAVQFSSLALADTLLSGVLLALVLGPDPRHVRLKAWFTWLQWPIYALAIRLIAQPELARAGITRVIWEPVALWLVGMGLVLVAVTVPGWFRALLAYPRLVWLGKISYGLYMFHELGFWLSREFRRAVGWFPNEEYLLPILSLALTIGLASASYYGYERRFLRWKRAWTRVPSRPL